MSLTIILFNNTQHLSVRHEKTSCELELAVCKTYFSLDLVQNLAATPQRHLIWLNVESRKLDTVLLTRKYPWFLRGIVKKTKFTGAAGQS